MKQVVVLLGLLAACPVMASDELAKKHACFACHTLDKKMVGPSYKDVAAKYRERQGGGEEACAQGQERQPGRVGHDPDAAQQRRAGRRHRYAGEVDPFAEVSLIFPGVAGV